MKPTLLIVAAVLGSLSGCVRDIASVHSPAARSGETATRSTPSREYLQLCNAQIEALKAAISALNGRSGGKTQIDALEQLLQSKQREVDAFRSGVDGIHQATNQDRPDSPNQNSKSRRTISVGNDPIARTWRDGADQITFINLSDILPSDGRIVFMVILCPEVCP